MKTVIIGAGHIVDIEHVERLAAELGKTRDEILIALERSLPERTDFESLKEKLEEVYLIKSRPSYDEYETIPTRTKRKGHQRPYKFHP